MVKRNDIWKFNEEEWKIHIKDESLKVKVQEKFNIGKSGTIYYENGNFQEETSFRFISVLRADQICLEHPASPL